MPAGDDMSSALTVGLIGDYNPAVTAHRAIPEALALSAAALGRTIRYHWLATDRITGADSLSECHGLWCVPASPYRSAEGALTAIRFARETSRPFLGTCGGFQHAVLEYARNVLGWHDAEHAETAPDAARAVIAPLECSLVEVSDQVFFRPGSRLASAYGALQAEERYHCRYGLNPQFAAELTRGPLRVTATDAANAVRGIELDGHPFFVATLFQPERAALQGVAPPVVAAFVSAIAHCAGAGAWSLEQVTT